MDGHTILICDDSATTRDVLCTMLGFEFHVLSAGSGEEALALCQNSFADLILLDVQMPGIDGFETCRRLKADGRNSNLPVIFMTGSKGVGSKVQGFDAGGVDFVDKPGCEEDLAEMSARIRTHLTIRDQRCQLERQNQELQRVQQQLIVQEKLASLGQLTAGIAHEIKNPLNFVVNFSQSVSDLIADLKTELAKTESERDREELDYILTELPGIARDIKANGDRAVRIINGMLEHSRGERGTRRQIDLNVLLEEYVNLAYHGMRSHKRHFNSTIRFDFDPALNERKISLTPQSFCRVVLNLATNAFQAMQSKYEDLGAQGYFPQLSVSTEERSSLVRIVFRDNGPGIPQEIREQIFEPFFTTKASGEGTGLGLSIAHEVVTREHKGRLLCDSKEGEWTEFTVLLPKGDK